MEIFLGKSESRMMTAFSGAFNKPVIDGNTILLKISEENDQQKYLYIGVDMVCSFLTNVNIYKYISNVGNNLIPYNIAIGEENIYFLTPDFECTKREKIKNIKSIERNGNFVDLFDSSCIKDSVEKLRT